MNCKNLKAYFLLCLSLTVLSCVDISIDHDCIEGQGSVITESLNIADFKGVKIDIFDDVTIRQGAVQKVEVTGQHNIIARLKTDVVDDIWIIELQEDCYDDHELQVDITMPVLSEIELAATGDCLIQDFEGQSDLNIVIAGLGDVILNDFDGLENMTVELRGTGDLIANSEIAIQNLDLKIRGIGEFEGFEIKSDNCVVSASGIGDTELTAINSLDVTITGTGDVSYKGMPNIAQTISGLGQLIDAN